MSPGVPFTDPTLLTVPVHQQDIVQATESLTAAFGAEPDEAAADGAENGPQQPSDAPEDPLALLLGAELGELLKVLTATAEVPVGSLQAQELAATADGDNRQPQEWPAAAAGNAFDNTDEGYAYAYDDEPGYDEGLDDEPQDDVITLMDISVAVPASWGSAIGNGGEGEGVQPLAVSRKLAEAGTGAEAGAKTGTAEAGEGDDTTSRPEGGDVGGGRGGAGVALLPQQQQPGGGGGDGDMNPRMQPGPGGPHDPQLEAQGGGGDGPRQRPPLPSGDISTPWFRKRQNSDGTSSISVGLSDLFPIVAVNNLDKKDGSGPDVHVRGGG